MKWRIFYGDGTTYDGDPFFAPSRNVQVIVCEDDQVGRRIIEGKEWWWWDTVEQMWFGGDENGMKDNLDQPGPRRVLQGRFIPDEKFNACLQRALADPDFPPKSARHAAETF